MQHHAIHLLIAVIMPSLSAATLTVDNRVEFPADFRTIQAAVDAAAVGDTILVSGSNTMYEGFTTTKRLHIIGERTGPLSASTVVRTDITFAEVFNDVDPNHLRHAGGSILESIETTGTARVLIYGACTGVTIKRCTLPEVANNPNVLLTGCSGALIQNSVVAWIGNFPGNAAGIQVRGAGNSVVGSWVRRIVLGNSENYLVENSVLGYYVGGVAQTTGPISTTANAVPFTIRNSIILGKTTLFDTTSTGNGRAIFDHCLSIGAAGLPAGSGNLSLPYTEFTNVFVGTTPNNMQRPEELKLKAGSPALGAGVNGVDLGMYGGSSPFVDGLLPAVPRVLHLAVPALVPDSTGLSFRVRAEARQ